MTQPTHLIFDCDGVLVDSEAIAIRVETQLLVDAGIPITEAEVAERFVGLTYTFMTESLEEQFGTELPPDLVPTIEQRVIDAFPAELMAVPGIDEFLSSNSLPRSVGSSSNLDRIQLSLGLTNLERHFPRELVFSAQMVERGKPNPDLFLFAAAQMGANPGSCLVIEDSPHGVTAAVRAGMPVVGLVAGGHATPALADRLLAAGADRVVAHPSEILPPATSE